MKKTLLEKTMEDVLSKLIEKDKKELKHLKPAKKRKQKKETSFKHGWISRKNK